MSVRYLLVAVLGLFTAAAEEPSMLRIPEDVGKKLVVTRVEPDYPGLAKQMKLAGRVVVDVFFDDRGNVEKVQPINGNPILTGAAVMAAKKWKFAAATGETAGRTRVTSVAFLFTL